MQRVTLRVPEQQVDVVDRLVEQGVFPNRSEAVRAALRDMLAQQPEVDDAVAELEPGPKNYSRLSTEGSD